MRSKVHIKGHPVHPMLISFPIAFAIGALVCDIVSRAGSYPNWYFVGYFLTVGAWATGLLAGIPGMLDYLFAIPNRTLAKRDAARHMLLNGTWVALFIISWLVKNSVGGTVPSGTSLVLEVIGIGILLTSGWLGWTLVYRHRIGIDERSEEERRERKVA